MAGRTARLQFNFLKVGEETLLRGRAGKFAYQYVHQFNNSPSRKKDGMKLERVTRADSHYVRRVK